jgi:hypothetical protein
MAIAWVSHICPSTLHISLTSSLANHDHAQLKHGLNRHKGGHGWLVKSYEQLRQKMQDLIANGDAPPGAVVPKQLSSDKLWDLDADDELWMDLTHDSQQQDDAPSRWLYDQPTQRVFELCSIYNVLRKRSNGSNMRAVPCTNGFEGRESN